MPIRQLTADVAAKIAAGEVVERPASVVKELIENSIDAGATQIRVDLMQGGLQLIRVSDNGSGIPTNELQLALMRHATSKVTSIDDLERIRSLGFRGEALASIAAVAEVTLLSRSRGEAQGALVSAASGRISDVNAAASPQGTTLSVRNLFSAVPARLKFLKSRHTEVSHCHHLLEQYALAYPEIRFSVFNEGRQIFATRGDGQLSSVLIEIYGLQIAEQLIPISSLDERDKDPERPVVSGYTSLPACYKSTRQHISFFVNRRWVLSRMLTAAVEEAYHSLLLSGRHPIAAVNITLDPTLLDVNVHPAKTEIRFLKERRVYAAVLRAVRQGLLHEAEMPTWHHSGKTHTSSERQGESGAHVSDEAIAPATADEWAHDDTSSYPSDNPWLTVTEEETGTKPPLLARLWQSHVKSSVASEHDAYIAPRAEQGEHVGAPGPETISVEPERPPQTNMPLAVIQQQAFGALPRKLPALRVIGQLAQSYIVTEGKEGMYLIDQHAAHERILLERMLAAQKARTPLSQMLLTPLQLQLAPQELEALEDHLQQLEQIGFELEIGADAQNASGTVLQVRAVPQVFVKQMNARSLYELLIDLTLAEQQGHSETWEEHALANVACKAAIKANYFLTVSEMREMLEQLAMTNAPYSCCHGRPTMVHFSQSALQHEFERR